MTRHDDQQADDLESTIVELDTLYDEGQDCVLPVDTPDWMLDEFGLERLQPVPNTKYDMMRDLLKEIRPDAEVLQQISGSTLETGARKVRHRPPMTSLDKANHELFAVKRGMLFRWFDLVKEGRKARLVNVPEGKLTADEEKTLAARGLPRSGSYPDGVLVKAYKLDGVALGIYYEKGVLKKAGLRPHRDGDYGEDVTANVRYVRGIPQKLKSPVTCSIRGEMICLLSDFETVQDRLRRIGGKPRANPRQHVQGAIRQYLDPTKTADGLVSFVGYSVEGLAHAPFKTEIERAEWARRLGIEFISLTPFDYNDLAKMEKQAKSLDYEVDGVVISVNDLEDQEQMGRAGDNRIGNPRGKIAWKFAEQEATPVLNEVEWKTRRTGVIKPVAIFDAVKLAGTEVGRATLHNLGFMLRSKIDRGAQIRVIKSGKIIPKVVGVVKPVARKVRYPETCPSCGSKTEVISLTQDMYELKCPNVDACPAQSLNRLWHFLRVLNVLGLGEKRVESLIDGGAVREYADFYRLTVPSAMNSGLSRRQALLALAAVQMIPDPDAMENESLERAVAKESKKVKQFPLWQFLAALGIRGVADSTSKSIVDHFHTLDAILDASPDELTQVENVGPVVAKQVYSFLRKHRKEVLALTEFIEPQARKAGKLTGTVFCFTGGFPKGKPYWEDLVEKAGGECKGSVSAKVTYLVVGNDPGSKVDRARTLGIPTIDLEALKRML